MHVLLFVGCDALMGGAGVLALAIPTNDLDNTDSARRAEMMQITLEEGELAPFPPSARETWIWTEGNMFTRTFIGILRHARSRRFVAC